MHGGIVKDVFSRQSQRCRLRGQDNDRHDSSHHIARYRRGGIRSPRRRALLPPWRCLLWPRAARTGRRSLAGGDRAIQAMREPGTTWVSCGNSAAGRTGLCRTSTRPCACGRTFAKRGSTAVERGRHWATWPAPRPTLTLPSPAPRLLWPPWLATIAGCCGSARRPSRG